MHKVESDCAVAWLPTQSQALERSFNPEIANSASESFARRVDQAKPSLTPGRFTFGIPKRR